jgi:hypothetical protein
MAWNYWKGQNPQEIEKVAQKCLIELTRASLKDNRIKRRR